MAISEQHIPMQNRAKVIAPSPIRMVGRFCVRKFARIVGSIPLTVAGDATGVVAAPTTTDAEGAGVTEIAGTGDSPAEGFGDTCELDCD
jgi:hypothetical protein